MAVCKNISVMCFIFHSESLVDLRLISIIQRHGLSTMENIKCFAEPLAPKNVRTQKSYQAHALRTHKSNSRLVRNGKDDRNHS